MLRLSPASAFAEIRGLIRGSGRCLGWPWAVSLALTGLVLAGATPAHGQTSREYDLKAVFLYNLASFVDWPSSAFATPDAPFVIAVVGEDPFGRVLDNVVAHESVGPHPFVVRRFRRSEDIGPCHVLFIGNSEARRVRDVLRRVRGRPVLTVADLPSFVETGGMVGFAKQADHLQLYVNPGALSAARLGVSSKLLEVARVVNTVATSP
jgi:hypothetical protein